MAWPKRPEAFRLPITERKTALEDVRVLLLRVDVEEAGLGFPSYQTGVGSYEHVGRSVKRAAHDQSGR